MPTIQRELGYLTTDELTRLRRHVEARATHAATTDAVTAVRSWALLDTLLSSGLRASEIAALRVGDCLLGYGQSSLLVQNGKGGKTREVFIADVSAVMQISPPRVIQNSPPIALLRWRSDDGSTSDDV